MSGGDFPASSVLRGSKKSLIFSLSSTFLARMGVRASKLFYMVQLNEEVLVCSSLTSGLSLGSGRGPAHLRCFMHTGPPMSLAFCRLSYVPAQHPREQNASARSLLFPSISELIPALRGPTAHVSGEAGSDWCAEGSRWAEHPLRHFRRLWGARAAHKRGLYLNLTFFVSPLHMNIYREESQASTPDPIHGIHQQLLCETRPGEGGLRGNECVSFSESQGL